MDKKPVLIIPIADTHTGSTVGLHPGVVKIGNEYVDLDLAGGWVYKHNENYYLNGKQKKMWKHYEAGIKSLAMLRQKLDAEILIVVMGDAIDGDHHQTHQLTTKNEGEQMKAHVALMQWTMETLGFVRGRDKLVYIEGTETHTKDNEELIAEQLQAERFGKYSCTPFLECEIYGKLFWFFHHGVASGYSFTKGTSLFGYIKKLYYDRKAEGKPFPNWVITADKHDADFQTFRRGNDEINGVICPPYQDKTRFANRLSQVIVRENKMGLSPLVVYPERVERLTPFLMSPPLNDRLVW